jgi:hypothetical protein
VVAADTIDHLGTDYPSWFYYPSRARPPEWAVQFVQAVASRRSDVDSATVDGLTSDAVLAALAPALVPLGYRVELGKRAADRIRLPVLFGDGGRERVAYEVDAFQDDLGVVVEIEAGRGARGNAVYRDLIRASLLLDARYLALGVMNTYRHNLRERRVAVESFREAKDQLDAVYASDRLQLPFKGLLLFGY